MCSLADLRISFDLASRESIGRLIVASFVMSAKLPKADVIDLSQGQSLVRVLVHAWIDMCKRG